VARATAVWSSGWLFGLGDRTLSGESIVERDLVRRPTATLARVSNGCSIVEGDTLSLALVGPLFEEMVEHHRRVAGLDWPVRDRALAWEHRRREYVDWLASGTAWLLLAVPCDAQPLWEPLGYAFLRLQAPGASWEMGAEVGELESLAVSEAARGRGIGTMLIDHARGILRARGIGYWSVAVVESNLDAVRLYERQGFRPYYRQLLAEV